MQSITRLSKRGFLRSFSISSRLITHPVSRVTPKALLSTTRAYSSSNDPLEKYKERLLQRAREEGIESVEELKEKYKDEIEEKKLEFNKVDQYLRPKEKADVENDKIYTTSGEQAPRGPRTDIPSPEDDIKDLDSFVDVSKFKLHDKKEIDLLWKARFANKDRTFCGSINGETFSRIYINAKKNPNFVLPLPHKDEGAELHFVQWSTVAPFTMHCIITSLAEYKLHQDYARPHTTMIFHSDLLADKEVALMNGNVEKDSNLTHDQGLFLSLNVQRFYGADETVESGLRKAKLLHTFNHAADQFSVDDLLSETETLD